MIRVFFDGERVADLYQDKIVYWKSELALSVSNVEFDPISSGIVCRKVFNDESFIEEVFEQVDDYAITFSNNHHCCPLADFYPGERCSVEEYQKAYNQCSDALRDFISEVYHHWDYLSKGKFEYHFYKDKFVYPF